MNQTRIKHLGTWPALLLAFSFHTLQAQIQETPLSVSSVTASSNDGNVPSNTLDGKLSTRWSAQGDGQWILYDLGSSKTVGAVAIAWYKGNQRVETFDIQTSLDKFSWTTGFTGRSCGTSTALEAVDIPDIAARYVRIVCHMNDDNNWNSITETRIYPPPANPPPPQVEETRLSVASVSASSDDGNVPFNTLDGRLDTRWAAEGDGQWILYDLGASTTVSCVDIAWYKGDQRIETFDIQTSLDKSSWTTVFAGRSCGTTQNFEAFDIPNVTARYVRIVGHMNTYNTWNSILETAIFSPTGSSDGTGGTSPPPPPPTEPPPPTTATLPSQVLNLTNWKLTLPVDTSRPGSPDEIKQPQLATFTDPDYFHVNQTGNGVVFTAPCGGGTTSGSSYPRSELREMTSNGTANASWSTTSGTHTMEITQAITHTPVVKPHVVAGQIHNSSDDVIVFRLEGTHLFIDQNGKTGPTLTGTYTLGDVFTVKFIARNGGVECYYNGRYIYTYPVSTSGCYFKAGCYTQSNTSKGDSPTAYGEVVIYSLFVTHQ